jgi:hypothetical protein
MFLASKNTQTTAYHRFHATRQNPKNANFQMNAGCCGNRNPLKGWRKEAICCNISDTSGSGTGWGYQMVLKNVQSCCKPSQLKMIQNRAASSPAQTAAAGKAYRVSGKIDRKYNYNYRQYLKKRCMIADYDNRSGGRSKTTPVSTHGGTQVATANCCTTNCSGAAHSPTLTYKRNNNNFYREGAVTNDLYIANKKVFANPCCLGTTQPKETSVPNPPIQTVNPNVTRTGVIHNFIPIKGGQTIPQ